MYLYTIQHKVPGKNMHFAHTIMVFLKMSIEISVYVEKLPKISKKLKFQISCFNICISLLDHSNGCFCCIYYIFYDFQDNFCEGREQLYFFINFSWKTHNFKQILINSMLVCPLMVQLSPRFWPDKSERSSAKNKHA